MSHANAALTPKHRLIVARLVVDNGVPIAEVAARFQCSWPTVKRWADRYRAGESMQDRSSRPHTSPAKTSLKVVKLCRMNRLSHVDRATGEPVRRYEHDHPGSLAYVDVKKVGNIPDGGGWRYLGRQQGNRNRAETDKPRNKRSQPKMGHAYIHSVIDDHSRMVYSEVHDDETAVTATAVLVRAVHWFGQRGVNVERVLSDNGSSYKTHLWHQVCAQEEVSRARGQGTPEALLLAWVAWEGLKIRILVVALAEKGWKVRDVYSALADAKLHSLEHYNAVFKKVVDNYPQQVKNVGRPWRQIEEYREARHRYVHGMRGSSPTRLETGTQLIIGSVQDAS